jgi:hypothetical protein
MLFDSIHGLLELLEPAVKVICECTRDRLAFRSIQLECQFLQLDSCGLMV